MLMHSLYLLLTLMDPDQILVYITAYVDITLRLWFLISHLIQLLPKDRAYLLLSKKALFLCL